MLKQWRKALLVAFVVGLPLTMAPTSGGFPSRPNFQTVRIANVPVFTTQSVTKAASTTRANTVTSTADPDLSITLQSGGTYIVGALLMFANVTTSTQGARYDLHWNGSFDPLRVVRCWNNRTTLLVTAVGGVQGMNADTTIPDVSTANDDIAEIRCVLRTASTSTLQVFWAQEASSANGTVLDSGSAIYAQRIGN